MLASIVLATGPVDRSSSGMAMGMGTKSKWVIK